MSIESFTFPAKRGSGDAAPGLERDLGPRNRYDQLAARAQLVGTQYRRPQLLAMGTRLSELTQDIPYSDDRFSKVEAFASEIEKEVAHVTEHATADLESIDQAGEWSCMLQIVRGRHAISAECWRGGTDQGPRTREALRVLRDAVSGSVEKEMTMEFGQGIGGGATLSPLLTGQTGRKSARSSSASTRRAAGESVRRSTSRTRAARVPSGSGSGT